jgi:hypothetical protein
MLDLPLTVSQLYSSPSIVHMPSNSRLDFRPKPIGCLIPCITGVCRLFDCHLALSYSVDLLISFDPTAATMLSFITSLLACFYVNLTEK